MHRRSSSAFRSLSRGSRGARSDTATIGAFRRRAPTSRARSSREPGGRATALSLRPAAQTKALAATCVYVSRAARAGSPQRDWVELQPADVLVSKAGSFGESPLREAFRFRSLSKLRYTKLQMFSANPCEQRAISSCDVNEPACDLWAMSHGTLLLWAVGPRTQMNGHRVFQRPDRADRLMDSRLASQQRPYMSGQYSNRKPIAPAKYRDPRGSAAHSRLQSHELSCAKAAIWKAIKPLAITPLLSRVRQKIANSQRELT